MRIMEEKGFRLVQCSGCPAKLRIAISAAQYGKTVEITCPKCKSKGRVTIPRPPSKPATIPVDFLEGLDRAAAPLQDLSALFKGNKKNRNN
jgi:phage FluMu protein Com